MKPYFALLLAALAAFSFQGCTQSTETKAETDPPKTFENQKRAAKPFSKSIIRYKTSPTDTVGTILSEEIFNEKGLRTEYISYDYYGSGKEDARSKFEYNEKGLLISDSDGRTTTTYKYDDQGRLSEEQWTRVGGEGEKKTFTYDDKGNITEEKHFTLDGKFDFSRVSSYEFNPAGKISTQKSLEKYSDGTEDLLLAHISWEFNAAGLEILKNNHRDDGTVYNTQATKYDGAGNVIEVADFDEGSETPTSTQKSTINQFGETIIDSVFNCGPEGCNSLQYTDTYRFDTFGNQIYMMYQHADGEAWGERTVFVYYP